MPLMWDRDLWPNSNPTGQRPRGVLENSNGPDFSGPLLSNTPRLIAVVIRVTSSSEISRFIKADNSLTQSIFR